MSALERNPEVPASTPDGTLTQAATAKESREASGKSHRDWTFLKPLQQVPEVPIITREELQVYCHNS